MSEPARTHHARRLALNTTFQTTKPPGRGAIFKEPMKYHIRIYYKGGFSYLWHRDKNVWCKLTATKYMNEWNARNPGSPAELEESAQ